MGKEALLLVGYSLMENCVSENQQLVPRGGLRDTATVTGSYWSQFLKILVLVSYKRGKAVQIIARYKNNFMH